MKEENAIVVVGLNVVVSLLIFAGLVTSILMTRDLKREAIERGFAHYNPTNGEWQWKTNVYLVPPGRFIEVLPLHAERP